MLMVFLTIVDFLTDFSLSPSFLGKNGCLILAPRGTGIVAAGVPKNCSTWLVSRTATLRCVNWGIFTLV